MEEDGFTLVKSKKSKKIKNVKSCPRIQAEVLSSGDKEEIVK